MNIQAPLEPQIIVTNDNGKCNANGNANGNQIVVTSTDDAFTINVVDKTFTVTKSELDIFPDSKLRGILTLCPAVKTFRLNTNPFWFQHVLDYQKLYGFCKTDKELFLMRESFPGIDIGRLNQELRIFNIPQIKSVSVEDLVAELPNFKVFPGCDWTQGSGDKFHKLRLRVSLFYDRIIIDVHIEKSAGSDYNSIVDGLHATNRNTFKFENIIFKADFAPFVNGYQGRGIELLRLVLKPVMVDICTLFHWGLYIYIYIF